MLKKIFIVLIITTIVGALSATAVGWYAYNYYARDLPKLDRVTDYHMSAVSSVFAADQTLVAEFFDEQRYPVKINDVPPMVRNAFLAAEDASFYKHPGIDLLSIFRAFIKNIQTGTAKQGGSTITQQVVKNILLTKEKKLDRKIKEAILAYRLENRLSKDDILELYLNLIFFGNRAYGIKAAARNYFAKEVDQLSIAEAAILAGLPQAPSRYSPVSNLPAAKNRQRYVLEQMVQAGFISLSSARRAAKEELQFNRASNTRVFEAPYYVTEVRRLFEQQWRDYNIDLDGLKIYTALDRKAYEFAEKSLRSGLMEVDKRQGWRGALTKLASPNDYLASYGASLPEKFNQTFAYPAYVLEVKAAARKIKVQLGDKIFEVDLKGTDWTKKVARADKSVRWSNLTAELKVGDIIEVSPTKDASNLGEITELVFNQTPRLEGSIVLLDPQNGHVVTVVGGYDYHRSQFNRATQGLRQPGSAFKPIIYLAAVDGFGYTPSTTVYDEPKEYRVGNAVWAPSNYDREYHGPMTLRTALEKSRNSISADIIARIGPEAAIKYARRLGIQSPMGANLSLSLGSSEVTPLEITRSYGVFANKGVLFPSVFITRIEDRFGQVIFDYQSKKLLMAEQVISEASAFVMAHMLKGVVEYGTGSKLKELKRPVAGKTGTSNQQMDTWFVGFTPEWACGVWVGHDEKEAIGHKETGGRIGAPIWLYFMQDYLKYRDQKLYQDLLAESKTEADRLGIPATEPEPVQPIDFSIPDGVEPAWISKSSGHKVEPGTSGAFLEYYLKGSGPNEFQPPALNQDYWTLPDF